ncbi:UNVERIFIED_ORG: phage I-like protein [Comamonas terrigena]
MTTNAGELQPAALKLGAAVRILPAGKFRAKDGRPGTSQSSITDWYLDATLAANVIAQFARLSSAVVIDFEHQTLQKEKNGQPAPAAGWFSGLEWREGDGLFMTQVEWTPTARQMILGKAYRHLSPVFRFDPHTGNVLSLHSVALTNDPALVGLVDLAAATAALTALKDAPMSDAITEKDRANLLHCFGHLPGFSEASGLHAPAQEKVSQADLAGMTEQEQANFLHVFGPGVLSGT